MRPTGSVASQRRWPPPASSIHAKVPTQAHGERALSWTPREARLAIDAQKDKLFPDAIFANGISYCALGTNLCYRRDKFPNGGPQSWADFWDVKKFPGTRSLYNNAPRTLAFALLADGVAPDKLYPMD